MTSFWLLVVVAAAIAVLSFGGFRAKGTRPVARTGLMTGARVAIVVLVIVLAWVALTR
jgi:hypothetical protein